MLDTSINAHFTKSLYYHTIELDKCNKTVNSNETIAVTEGTMHCSI